MDCLIASFSQGKMEDLYFYNLEKYGGDGITKFAEMLSWVIIDLENDNELLGESYMQLSSRSKASALGQFFTPMPICVLMAQIVEVEPGKTICDPACGSGRTLLAAARGWSDLKKMKTRFFCFLLEKLTE